MFRFAPLLFWSTERSSNVHLVGNILPLPIPFRTGSPVADKRASCGGKEEFWQQRELLCDFTPPSLRFAMALLQPCWGLSRRCAPHCGALPHTCQRYSNTAEPGCQKGDVAQRDGCCVASLRGVCAPRGSAMGLPAWAAAELSKEVMLLCEPYELQPAHTAATWPEASNQWSLGLSWLVFSPVR